MPPTQQERGRLYYVLLSLLQTLQGVQSVHVQRGKSMRVPALQATCSLDLAVNLGGKHIASRRVRTEDRLTEHCCTGGDHHLTPQSEASLLTRWRCECPVGPW